MKKNLCILLTCLFSLNSLASYSPITIKGQSDSSKSTVTNIEVPAKQATLTAPSTYKIETGNTNLLTNPSFDHSTVTTGWTVTCTGTATYTLTTGNTSTLLLKGEKNYGWLTVSGGASGGTCSLIQSVDVTQGLNTLIGMTVSPEPLGLGAGCDGTMFSKVYTLIGGTATTNRVTATDVSNCGSATVQTPVYVNEVASFSTAGVEYFVTVAASNQYRTAIDRVEVSQGNHISTSAIITPWQSYTPTFTGFGTVSIQSFRWRQVGGSIEIEGRFTAGTTTATEARISLPNSLTSSSTYNTLELAGIFTQAGNLAGGLYTVIEPSVSYMTISIQSSAAHAFTKAVASNVLGTGGTGSLKASVKIDSLAGSTQVFASQCGANCENKFSGKVSSTGVVTSPSPTDANISCSISDTSLFTCTINSPALTVGPTCIITEVQAAAGTDQTHAFMAGDPISASFKVRTGYNPGSGTSISKAAYGFSFECTKTGADYQSSRTIVGSFKDVMSAPGVGKPKTCYAGFGGASATLASPTVCSTGTCVETFDSCGTFSPPTFSSTGYYLNATFGAGTFANNSYIHCSCEAFSVTNGTNYDCSVGYSTTDNTWQTSSAGSWVNDIATVSLSGTFANLFVTLKCEGQAP